MSQETLTDPFGTRLHDETWRLLARLCTRARAGLTLPGCDRRRLARLLRKSTRKLTMSLVSLRVILEKDESLVPFAMDCLQSPRSYAEDAYRILDLKEDALRARHDLELEEQYAQEREVRALVRRDDDYI